LAIANQRISNKQTIKESITSITMASSVAERSYQSILKDMRSARPEVLRQTARDVFLQKVSGFSSGCDPNVGSAIASMDDASIMNAVFSETDRVPKFGTKDLIFGRVMGRGTFCVVRECHFNSSSTGSIGSSSSRGSFLGRLTSSSGLHVNNNMSSIPSSSGHRTISSERSESSTLQRFRRKGGNKSRYVMKQLSSELKDSDKMTYLKGIVDLAMETRILASLDHENIVKLEAVSSCDAFSEGYFIVLEKVNETLSKKVKGWMDLDRQCTGITGVFTGSKSKIQRLQSERIAAAYDMSVGMNYLHERRIVFRDLVSHDLVVAQSSWGAGFSRTTVSFSLSCLLSHRNRTMLASTTSEFSRFLILVWPRS
jgi:serine/threonine protein kinase